MTNQTDLQARLREEANGFEAHGYEGAPELLREAADALDYFKAQWAAAEARAVAAERVAAQNARIEADLRKQIGEEYQAKQAAEARAVALEQERDKWLDAFNRSEQFQDGPTKRAEDAEQRLAVVSALSATWRSQAHKWRTADNSPYDGEWADTLDICADELDAALSPKAPQP